MAATQTPKPLSKRQLDDLIQDAAAALAKMAEEEEQAKLAKADPGEAPPEETTPSGSSADPPPDDSAPPADAKDSAPPEASSAPPGGDGDADDASAAPPPAEGSAGGDPAADQDAGPEALAAEYSSLPPPELAMHAMAVMHALVQMVAQSAGAGAPPPGASAGPPPPAGPPGGESSPAPDASGAPPVGKAEMGSHAKANGSKPRVGKSQATEGESLRKAQDDRFAAMQKNIDDLSAALQAKDALLAQLAEGLHKSLHPPVRKSVERLSDVTPIGKPGAPAADDALLALPRAAVKERLSQVLRTNRDFLGGLTKSERDAVARFDMDPTMPVSAVLPVLKKAQQ